MQKRNHESSSNRWFEWVVVFIGALLALRSGIAVFRLWKAGDRLEVAQTRLSEVEQENIKLKGELAYTKTDDFVEKEAREKLGYGNEGEVILILPENSEVGKMSSEELESQENRNMPKWKKWWKLYVR
jgi:cell division protein FtsB